MESIFAPRALIWGDNLKSPMESPVNRERRKKERENEEMSYSIW
jgi:hypothetical protein